MGDLPSRVHILEEGPREGFQIEPRVVPTDEKLELISALSECGLGEIQAVSFVPPANVPGWADADEVAARLPRRPGVKFSGMWLNQRGYERALAHRDTLTVDGDLVFSMSESFLMSNQRIGIDANFQQQRRLGSRYLADGVGLRSAVIMTAFGCNREGLTHPEDLLDTIGMVLALVADLGTSVQYISLADTMGWATPATMTTMLDRIRTRFPDLEIGLHLHDTRGVGLATAWAALSMGVRHFDTALAGLGGCPFAFNRGEAGNICTEDFVYMCATAGIETGVDLDRLIEAARLAERIVGHVLPGSLKLAGMPNAQRPL